MTKKEIRQTVTECIGRRCLCGLQMIYDGFKRYVIPLAASEKLFMGAVEYDFCIDGYTVRRFSDVEDARLRDDKYMEIIEREGLLSGMIIPEIDITGWKEVFRSLMELNKIIIVEAEKENLFAIGRIEKTLSDKVRMRIFDGEGIWQDEKMDIAYGKITSVSFSGRYAEVFSKYV